MNLFALLQTDEKIPLLLCTVNMNNMNLAARLETGSPKETKSTKSTSEIHQLKICVKPEVIIYRIHYFYELHREELLGRFSVIFCQNQASFFTNFLSLC